MDANVRVHTLLENELSTLLGEVDLRSDDRVAGHCRNRRLSGFEIVREDARVAEVAEGVLKGSSTRKLDVLAIRH